MLKAFSSSPSLPYTMRPSVSTPSTSRASRRMRLARRPAFHAMPASRSPRRFTTPTEGAVVVEYDQGADVPLLHDAQRLGGEHAAADASPGRGS
jgi:hypothetical protein